MLLPDDVCHESLWFRISLVAKKKKKEKKEEEERGMEVPRLLN